MSDSSARSAMVVGASRGLGRGIATALAAAGAPVVAVSRTAAEFADAIRPVVADAVDATVPARLLDRHQPDALILVAGAEPQPREASVKSATQNMGNSRDHRTGARS